MADINTSQDNPAATESTTLPPRPEKKATLRLGQRELTRISLAVILILVLALGMGVFSFFQNFKRRRDVVIARYNMLAVYKALRGYSEDWDGKLPAAANWTDSVLGYLSAPPGSTGGREAFLHGDSDSGETIGYVYNDLLSGYNLERPDAQKYSHPSKLVVLIEKPGAQPNEHVTIPPQDSMQGEAALYKLLSFPHFSNDPENATTVVLYADGHIEAKRRIEFSQSKTDTNR